MPRDPRVEVYVDDAGEVRWTLYGGNNEVVLPPQGHRDPHDAVRALTTASLLLVKAIELGAIHVVQIDTDAQHVPEAIDTASIEHVPTVAESGAVSQDGFVLDGTGNLVPTHKYEGIDAEPEAEA